jgi:predicted RNase H-like HicB family nuclease
MNASTSTASTAHRAASNVILSGALFGLIGAGLVVGMKGLIYSVAAGREPPGLLSEAMVKRTLYRWPAAASPEDYNLRMKQLTLAVIVESDADGYFVSCPALDGCYSQGTSYDEAIENIKDAIRLHVEDRIADGEEMPEGVSASLSTVQVSMIW